MKPSSVRFTLCAGYMATMSSRFPPDAVRQLAVFAVTGVVNTLIHLLVVVALVEWWAVYPALANACVFCRQSVFFLGK